MATIERYRRRLESSQPRAINEARVGVRELIGVPYSAYLTPRGGAFRLYVALLGRGLIRIDTTLPTVRPIP